MVYGHTHHHEVVPLDSFPGALCPTNQMYINSGTWHTYYDLAINKPEEQKFIPYQALTYLASIKITNARAAASRPGRDRSRNSTCLNTFI